MARPRLFILDPNLRDLKGHYFEYGRAVSQAAVAEGLDCVVLSHRDAALPGDLPFAVHPVYSVDIWKRFPHLRYQSERNTAMVSELFAAETFEFLAGHPLNGGDVVFMPNMTGVQLPGAAALAEALPPRGVQLSIMLRYQHALYVGRAAARAFDRLEQAAERQSIQLCTDSHRLVPNLAALTRLPIRLFPIPGRDDLAGSHPPSSDTVHRVHFVSLGDARGEKGIAEIFEAIRMTADQPWADRVRFTLQCNHASQEVTGAIEDWRQRPDPRVTLVDRILSSEQYAALLVDADAVLLPYHRDIYRERTSGVFGEAMAAGKVIVCTSDTWMSDTLDKYGGGIVVADRAPRDLSLVLGAVVADLPTLQERAAAASMQWRKFNSPSNFISHLLGRPAISAALPRPRKAAVIYPWGNASAEQAGSAMRMRFLVKYLEQQDFRVRVLFSSASGCGGTIGSRSTAEPYGYNRFGTRVLGFLLRKLAGLLGGTPVQSLHLWFHLWPRIDVRFAARCEEVIRWADEVYLEYSYFSSVVTGLCRRYNKPLVLTQHDILADQAKNVPLIYQLTRWLELRSLRQTPRVVACSRADAELCATHGINAEVIAHPMDIRDYYGLSPADAARILNDRLGIATHGTHVCFFVGSAHGPNRQAAQFIRAMASDLRSNHSADSIVFVVAGACMDRCDDGNFVSLGSIDDAGLAALYRMAAIVLVPLQEGTGSSVKSIEALARGAVVLSTTIGMRGIPVVAGRHCVIEDNLGAYPDRIFEIIQDTDKAASLRAAALQLGSDYDYRTVFAAYRSPDRTQGVHATPSHSPQSRETVLVRRVL